MRAIKLTLEGFTSFRKCQTLDFSKLDLFAITGATGAGKSSLLDAITFALYGKVARLGKTSGTELVSQGATALKVEFQFAVQQTEYKVTRTWQFRPKRPKTHFRLEKWQEGTWKQGDSTQQIENILKMDFNTFIRVILLPQGQFDELLKREPKKRRELLRQLAGLEIIEQMRQEASQRAKQYQGKRETIEDFLIQLQVPTKEEILEKQAQLVIVGQTVSLLQNKVAYAQKLLAEEERLLAQRIRFSELQALLSKCSQETETINFLEQQLQQAQQADRLAGEWALVQASRIQYEEAQSIAERATEKVTDALEELQGFRATLMDYVGRQLKIAEVRIKAADYQRMKAEQIFTQTQPGGTRLEQLQQIFSTLIQWQAKNQQVQEIRDKWQQATEQLQLAHLEYQKATVKLEQAEARLQEAQADNEALIQQNHATVLRLSLQCGDSCPVCGSRYPAAHQLPPLPEISLLDIEPLQAQKLQAEQSLQTARLNKIKAETTLENLQDLPAKEAELAKWGQKITEILQTDDWEAQALEQEYQALQEMDEQYQIALQQKEQAESELDKAELAHRFAQETYDETKAQYQDNAEELERQHHQRQQAEMELLQQTEELAYDALAQMLEHYEEQLAVHLNKANRLYQNAHDHFIQIETTETQAIQELEWAYEEQEQYNTAWQKALQSADLTEDYFLTAQASPEQQAQWEATIRQYEKQKIALETEWKAMTTAMGELSIDENKIEQLREAKWTAEQEVHQANRQQAELSAWLNNSQEKQQQAKNGTKQITSLNEQEQAYHILSLKLQSNEFQSYLLENLEIELVNRATVLLQELTEGRYILKLQNGGYWVEDNWNGGESRRVQTLSGGETFATSLAMALALSEKLAMGIELGSLFLDEGFGTLDAESLTSVTQILESLRQQDKLIGVITHIPELAEQLPTQVKVHKSPEGSQLEIR